MKIIWVLCLFMLTISTKAQYKQQLRGTVTDQVLQKPLAGATVTIDAIGKATTTSEDGTFRFADIPLGQYRINISVAGYKEIVLDNIIINSGKETVITSSLDALVKTETEVLLKSNSKKNKPLNDMSLVSARAFTVEETQKYAAAVNDPLRMATSFAGVIAADDGNNSIVIRGNSPNGLLWKMEGMDIPNPNHFGTPGNSGGGISILSSQLLSNSDFITAAFAAEYGNALSGVFDIKLRKGNNEKKEYTVQAGVLGLNGAAEGPLSKNYKGSYLINYRYSTLSLLSKMKVLPDDGATNFQDLAYNFYLPTKKLGTFTIFGFGGLSDQTFNAEKDSAKWEKNGDRYSYKFLSNTGMTGLTHSIFLGNKINIKSAIGISQTKIGYDEHFREDDYSLSRSYLDQYKTRKWIFNSTLNYKFNNRLSVRSGFIINLIHYNFYQVSSLHQGTPLRELLNTSGNTATQQAFAQWQYKPSDNITVTGGLHYLHLQHNNSSSLEPRFAAKWNINNRSSLAVGYGLHSQLQTLNVYFAQQKLQDATVIMPNKNLDFTRAHHYVVSYGYRLAKNLQVKAELYYQQLFNVPVSIYDTSSLSTLNIQSEYFTDALTNKGKGRNYGVEISLERYLQNNFYLTLSNSIYQSKYTARDRVERNTRFNGNYIVTLIAGKDFVNEQKAKTFGINIKTIYAGGFRNTPIDLAASQQAGYSVFKEKEAYSLQNPAYFRTDLRVSIKWNRKNLTSTLSLDIQNIGNRLNVYSQCYDKEQNEIVTYHQTGLIPILNYKIEF
ncbi:carboxypeptidase-like regulatory domain-containing protein [soil metagenome]